MKSGQEYAHNTTSCVTHSFLVKEDSMISQIIFVRATMMCSNILAYLVASCTFGVHTKWLINLGTKNMTIKSNICIKINP